jgi:hypothetical protein
MKYTAGPWTVAAGPTYCAIRTDARVIADMRLVGLHYNKADALLISAAPDLLDALREAEAGLEFAGADKLTEVGGFAPAPLAALRIVRAAIKKATGATN